MRNYTGREVKGNCDYCNITCDCVVRYAGCVVLHTFHTLVDA